MSFFCYALQRPVCIASFPEVELRQPRQEGYRVSDDDMSVGFGAGIAISSVASSVCDVCAGRRRRCDPKACIRSVGSSGRCTLFFSTGLILVAAARVTISPLFEYQPANPDEATRADQHWKQLGRVRDISVGSEHVDDIVPNHRQLDLRCNKGDIAEIDGYKYPEKSGSFFVECVEGEFGPGGGRQKIQLGFLTN